LRKKSADKATKLQDSPAMSLTKKAFRRLMRVCFENTENATC